MDKEKQIAVVDSFPTTSFKGLDRRYITTDLKQKGHTPDCAGAVGKQHFAQLLNGGYAVYNKSNGSQSDKPVSANQFWTNAGASCAYAIDPRIVFVPDAGGPGVGKWLATQINNHNDLMYATTKADNPLPSTGYWKGVNIKLGAVRPDFTRLGYDGDGVYIAVSEMRDEGTYDTTVVYIPRPQAFDHPLDLAHVSVLPPINRGQFGETLFPVINRNSSRFAYFIGVDTSTSPRRNLTYVLMQKTPSPVIVGGGKIEVEPFEQAALAHQPMNVPIQPGGPGIASAPWCEGNYIWVTHGITTKGFCGVRWYRLFINHSGLPQLDAWGEVKDPDSHFDFYNASIGFSPNSNRAVIACTRSGDSSTGTKGNAGAYAAIISFAGDASDTEIVELQPGLAGNFQGERWGDYSTICLDPAPDSPRRYWMTNEYAISNDNWGTMFGYVSLPPSEGC